jgi:hypothetical protein
LKEEAAVMLLLVLDVTSPFVPSADNYTTAVPARELKSAQSITDFSVKILSA